MHLSLLLGGSTRLLGLLGEPNTKKNTQIKLLLKAGRSIAERVSLFFVHQTTFPTYRPSRFLWNDWILMFFDDHNESFDIINFVAALEINLIKFNLIEKRSEVGQL